MVNAQEWLDRNYPKETRKNITNLNFSSKDLEGSLDLSDFANLEDLNCPGNKLSCLNVSECFKLTRLSCYSNHLTNLNINNCTNLTRVECDKNLLTSLNWETLDPQKLTFLSIYDNNFPQQNLSCFSRFVNLKELRIGSRDTTKLKQGIYNRFYGSLEFLKNLTKLETLEILNTDIDSGLEYLPKTVRCFFCADIYRPESKVKTIAEQLKPFLISNFIGSYNWEEWRKTSLIKSPIQQKETEKSQTSLVQEQMQELINIVLPNNQTYDFTALKKEVKKLKSESITNQIENKKTETEQLTNLLQQEKLHFKTRQELQNLVQTKQREINQLEYQLSNLQIQETQIQIPPK